MDDPDPVFDDDIVLLDEGDFSFGDEYEYAAPTTGRQLGVQSVPRFELPSLRPFEIMFADNKDYPCKVRGCCDSVHLGLLLDSCQIQGGSQLQAQQWLGLPVCGSSQWHPQAPLQVPHLY